jgi:hypothetical protein
VRELATAAALNRNEWTLRLWLAELLPGMGLVDEALQLLTQLPRTDARGGHRCGTAGIEREFGG